MVEEEEEETELEIENLVGVGEPGIFLLKAGVGVVGVGFLEVGMGVAGVCLVGVTSEKRVLCASEEGGDDE